MKVEDYYPEGKRWWVRLHEKGGKRQEMLPYHKLELFLDGENPLTFSSCIPPFAAVTLTLDARGFVGDVRSTPLLLR